VVYDVFETANGEKILFGVMNDKQWTWFGKVFDLDDLLQDAEFQTNVQRAEFSWVEEYFSVQW